MAKQQRLPKAKLAKVKQKTYTEKLQEKLRHRNISKTFVLYYHTQPFKYFHQLIRHLIVPSNKYRKEFWQNITSGSYGFEVAQKYLKEYKTFIEAKIRLIVETHSIVYWLHLTRRIAPNTLGDDKRVETIIICRNIITAAIQKFGQFNTCESIKSFDDVSIEHVFDGLLLDARFTAERQCLFNLPQQLVLTKFNENNLLEYYELERLAYELWLAGSKARVTAKGANLIIDNNDKRILLDDRNDELAKLMNIHDKRSISMSATATATVFEHSDSSFGGQILLLQIIGERLIDKYSDPITELLEIEFETGGAPNFGFVIFDIKMYLQAHLEFSNDFLEKWGVKFEYVVAIIADIGTSVLHEIINEKNYSVATNLMFRGYRMFQVDEYLSHIKINWSTTIHYLDVNIPYNDVEVQKAYDFLLLNPTSRESIFIDSFGPLKLFTPANLENHIIIDYSVIGDILYNLFHSLPLKDYNFKGELLEKALKLQDSYLPTTESKGYDGTSKQVDFSFAKDDILVLVECKAVARSFGVFGGQAKAIQHRLRNVIHKGLDDVDEKVKWFLKHPQGTNFDISHFKYIIGIAVSPFIEFMPSLEDKYWLNEELPRVLTIDEFKDFLLSDLKKVVIKNLIKISAQ